MWSKLEVGAKRHRGQCGLQQRMGGEEFCALKWIHHQWWELWHHVNVRGRMGKRQEDLGAADPRDHLPPPLPFPAPTAESAWPSVPFPGQLPRAGGLPAPGGNLCRVFTAGTQGDRESGRVLTMDTGRNREGGLDV